MNRFLFGSCVTLEALEEGPRSDLSCDWASARLGLNSIESQQTFQHTFQQSFKYYRGCPTLSAEKSVVKSDSTEIQLN